MNPTVIAMLLIGFVLLYGAVKNRNPLDVVKSAISRQPLSNAKPIMS